MHVTMAVLSVEENEEEEMKRKFSILGDMYRDILHSKVGFVITCNGVKFFDHGSVVLPVQVGKELLHVFRDLINENFTEFIVDGRFIPHISVFRKNTMDDVSKEQLGQSLDGHNTGILVCEKITLRAIKTSENKSPREVASESMV